MLQRILAWLAPKKAPRPPFEGFDLDAFWADAQPLDEESGRPDDDEDVEDESRPLVEPPLTDETIAAVERDLGYTLPASYIALAKVRNGGVPTRRNHRTIPNNWAKDHVSIDRIFAIGHTSEHSLCGGTGSRFWMEEWDYPPIGVYFADTPMGGHDMLCLDYRTCGPRGEPAVVHVDQTDDFKITPVAPSFEAFIRGLEGDEAFEE